MSFYWYSGSSFVPVNELTCSRVIIDSFLVIAGQVRGLDLHLKRFGSCIPRVLSAEFATALTAILPSDGRWFPRLEYDVQSQEIYLRLRPAPQLRTSTRLDPTGIIDPREKPQVKGWDLAVLSTLRAAAEARGYDDAVLLDATGHPKETTTGVLAFLRNETLYTPSTHLGILPSVTWELTKQALDNHKIHINYGVYEWQDFRNATCVVGNALHGWTDVVWESESPSGTAAWLNSLIMVKDLGKNHNF